MKNVHPESGAQSFSIQSCADPNMGFLVGCIALKPTFKALGCVMFTFIICQNTQSTNAKCALNSVTKL